MPRRVRVGHRQFGDVQQIFQIEKAAAVVDTGERERQAAPHRADEAAEVAWRGGRVDQRRAQDRKLQAVAGGGFLQHFLGPALALVIERGAGGAGLDRGQGTESDETADTGGGRLFGQPP